MALFKPSGCQSRRNHWLIIAIIMLSLWIGLTAAGCQPSEETASGVRVDWEMRPNPPKAGETTTVHIALRDSTGELLSGAEVKLEGNMSHPGMKPVLTTAKEVAPGRYSAELNFSMGGDWFLLIESTLSDSRVVERQVEISGVRTP